MLAVSDYLKIPPNELKTPLELGQNGIDFVCRKFQNRFENVIYGFDRRMLFWYWDKANSIDAIVISLQTYIRELLRP